MEPGTEPTRAPAERTGGKGREARGPTEGRLGGHCGGDSQAGPGTGREAGPVTCQRAEQRPKAAGSVGVSESAPEGREGAGGGRGGPLAPSEAKSILSAMGSFQNVPTSKRKPPPWAVAAGWSGCPLGCRVARRGQIGERGGQGRQPHVSALRGADGKVGPQWERAHPSHIQ